MKYAVSVMETYCNTIIVEAADERDAEDKVCQLYDHGLIDVDLPDNYLDTTFECCDYEEYTHCMCDEYEDIETWGKKIGRL